MVWKSSFEMMNCFTPWWVHNTHCQGNPVWSAIPATTFPSIPRKWPASSFYQDTHRNDCAPLSLICLAFSKSRNHQDNAMSVLRFFDAANTDFGCVRPQWELNQNHLFTKHSFDPWRSLADLSTSVLGLVSTMVGLLKLWPQVGHPIEQLFLILHLIYLTAWPPSEQYTGKCSNHCRYNLQAPTLTVPQRLCLDIE